jgi:hypothetical protein
VEFTLKEFEDIFRAAEAVKQTFLNFEAYLNLITQIRRVRSEGI